MQIKYSLLETDYIEIEIIVKYNDVKGQNLLFPRFRPGKYSIENWEKNTLYFNIFQGNQPIKYENLGQSEYLLHLINEEDIVIKSKLVANIKIDAGNNCYNSKDLVNILPNLSTYYFKDYTGKYNLEIITKPNIDLSTNLTLISKDNLENSISYKYTAENTEDLFDSPICGGVKNSNFHQLQIDNNHGANIFINFFSNFNYDLQEFSKNFTNLVNEIIDSIGYFPVDVYYFHIFNFPNISIHGVEHSKSTVISLGSQTDSYIKNNKRLENYFYSISAHEFFHTWNAKKIRPSLLTKYNYQNEVFFDSCSITEGLTSMIDTFYIYKCGLIDISEFLEMTFGYDFCPILDDEKKYLAGNVGKSLASHSINLWKGGYTFLPSSGEKFIYSKGALIMFYLHFKLKQNYGKNIFDFIKQLLNDKQIIQNGYKMDDIKSIISEITKDKNFADSFVNTYILSEMTYDQTLKLIEEFEEIGITTTYEEGKHSSKITNKTKLIEFI